MGQSSKSQTVIKPQNSNCDKTCKLKLWQHLKKHSKTHTVTKLNLDCDKTKKILFGQYSTFDKTCKALFVRTTWHLDNRWDVLLAAFCNIVMFYLGPFLSQAYDF